MYMHSPRTVQGSWYRVDTASGSSTPTTVTEPDGVTAVGNVFGGSGSTVKNRTPEDQAVFTSTAQTLYLKPLDWRGNVDGTGVVVTSTGVNITPSADPTSGSDVASIIAGLPTTYASRISAVLGRRTALPNLSKVDAVMASPPTVGTLSTSSVISGGVLVPPVSNSGTGLAILNDHIAYRGAGDVTWAGTGYPGTLYIKTTSLTTVPAGAPLCADIITDAPVIEIEHNAGGAQFRVRVDGELVSATPITLANDGAFYFQPLTFATRTFRRISVEMSANQKFAGFRVGPTDTVEKPALRGPRCIVVGDSFTEGTGGTSSCMGWVRVFGEAMGWDDVWPSGVGSTGYLNPATGGKVKFRDRLTNDVLNQSPQVVLWAGGLTDQGAYTAAAIQAEALACYQAVQAALPGVIQIVLSPFWGGGVETYTAALLDTRDAIKTAVTAANTALQPVYFIDLLEMPIDGTVAATTLASGNSISATSLSATGFVPAGATIEIDTGSARERRVVTAVGGSGPYTLNVAAMTAAHSSGTVVTQVGPGYMTGSGRVGTTTGSGNSDLLRASDGTHPTQAGHEHIGRLVRSLIARQILAA